MRAVGVLRLGRGPLNLAPWAFCIPAELAPFGDLLSRLGVREAFSAEQYVGILDDMAAALGEQALAAEQQEQAISVLQARSHAFQPVSCPLLDIASGTGTVFPGNCQSGGCMQGAGMHSCALCICHGRFLRGVQLFLRSAYFGNAGAVGHAGSRAAAARAGRPRPPGARRAAGIQRRALDARPGAALRAPQALQ